MNIQLYARAFLAFIVSAILVLQPAGALSTRAAYAPETGARVASSSTADAIILRAHPYGVSAPTCGGGWDPAAADPALRPCNLQYALTARIDTGGGQAGGSPWEVWVKAGWYDPTPDETDHAASFVMRNGVSIYGGFGGTETAREQRDWGANETVLSGNIGVTSTTSSHACHVVQAKAAGIGPETVLDGLTILGGSANGAEGCQNGGGMVVEGQARPTLSNLIFKNNIALNGGGLYISGSAPTLHNVVFQNNQATQEGGGVFNTYGYPTITNALFSGNSAFYGGGMFNEYGVPAMTNVTFINNSAEYCGGGLVNNEAHGLDYPMLNFATFLNNTAPVFGGAIQSYRSEVKITNSILWGSTPDQVYHEADSRLVLQKSIIQGGCPEYTACTSLLDSDPLLGPLTGAPGQTPYLPLLPGSPAVDELPEVYCAQWDATGASRPLDVDQRGAFRPAGKKTPAGLGFCDLGAYEAQDHWYVDDSAAGANDGLSWGDAFTDLQSALGAAQPGDEIWVAEGLYIPSARSDPADPRSATFRLPPGVAVYGGFAAAGTTRDWRLHPSHLSGDIDRNDLQRPSSLWTDLRGANAYHVVDASGPGAAVILDGFTISGGQADDSGGGISALSSSLTLMHLILQGNSASRGGGLLLTGPARQRLLDVTFRGNRASQRGGGAALASLDGTLEDVRFEGNQALNGGGLELGSGRTTINGAVFSGNGDSSTSTGGGLLVDGGSVVVVTNATFYNNTATEGAAIMDDGIGAYSLNLSNTTIFGNRGGTATIAAYRLRNLWIRDSILWGNDDAETIWLVGGQRATIENSIVQGGCPPLSICVGVSATDPMLGSYLAQVGFGSGRTSGPTAGFPLRAGSPAIDAGSCEAWTLNEDGNLITTPLTRDQRGLPRPSGALCDLGAFEYAPRTIYVDDSASGANDGSSWASAYTNLQDGLAAAVNGDEVWVAAGTYYPTRSPSERNASFVLRPEVGVYGGFAGTESAREERDWAKNITTLSGDINHDGPGGNAYHVVFSDGYMNFNAWDTTVLDGFTITGGEADGPLGSAINRQGGGLYIHTNQPTLRNLVISGNRAEQGGGMWNNGYAQLINVLFQANQATYGGGLANGERDYQDYQHAHHQAILTNVTFSQNTAQYGGAIANRGVYTLYIPPEVTQPDLNHVTFMENTATAAGSAIYSTASETTINNSIVWGMPGLIAADSGSTLRFNRDIIAGGCPSGAVCSSVSSADPRLYPLGTALGGPASYPLAYDSPAIDAAPAEECTRILFTGTFTNERLPLTFDQRGAPRPAGAACDLGAHEYQPPTGLTIVSGDNQRTAPFSAFPGPLVVGFTSPWGDRVDGLVVHFTPVTSDAGGSVSSSTAVVSGGKAQVTATAQNAPGFSVEASEPGFNPVTFHLAVNDTTVTLSASPNPAAYGQSVTLSARVEGKTFGFPPTPSGTVTFKEGERVLGAVTLPPAQPLGDPFATATLSVSNLAVGTHTLTAVYSGDTFYKDTTTSAPLALNVNKASASLRLDGLAQGYSGTARAVTVSTTPPNLAARVTYNGSTQPPVNAGEYSVYAEITDPNYSGSAAGKLVIAKAVLDVRADPLTRKYGQENPALTYTISGYVNGEGASAIQGAPALSCAAGPSSAVGSYTIEISQGTLAAANYSFHLWNNKLYVTQAGSTTKLMVSEMQGVYGRTIWLWAIVTGEYAAGGAPQGSLTFSVDGSQVNTATLNLDGLAEYALSGLGVGQHTIQAAYAGSKNHAASSASEILTIDPAATQILPGVAPNPAAPGQPVTLTATVALRQPGVNVTPTGSVIFEFPDIPPQTVRLVNGQASAVITMDTPGVYTGTANYLPDPEFSASCAFLPLTVNALPATVTLGNLSAVYNGQPHPATATTNPPGLTYRITYGGKPDLPVKAGEYAVAATITDQRYSGSASGTLVIDQAELQLSAQDASREYGAANPMPAYSLNGFMPGEGESLVSGAPKFGELPGPSSPPGPYPISISVGSLRADNYTIYPVPGVLTITRAATTLHLSSTPGPHFSWQPIPLTLRVDTAVSPGLGIPGGALSLRIDGGAPVTVGLGVDGSAVYLLNGLAPGEHSIRVEYAGDALFAGSATEEVVKVTEGMKTYLPVIIH